MVISGNFNLALVLLSVVIAAASSYTALDLAGRVRVSAGRSRAAWLIAAAVAMAGGIWSMHFVAMLAFVMPMPVAYGIGRTVLSLVIAIVLTGVAFAIVSRGRAGWAQVALAGLLMGVGICSMHYIGMSAMRMDASINYDGAMVGLSCVIAGGASIIGLWLAFKTTSLSQRVVAALVMGIAVSGMHYTGMAAATFTMAHSAAAGPGSSALAQVSLAIAVSATTFLILFLAVVSSVVDRRLAAVSLRESMALRESEEGYRRLYEALQAETTQRVRAEAALRQLQKMEAVGQLTGGIAHDFNNILTVIVGNLDPIVRGLPETSSLRRRGEVAMRGAMRAAELTQRLLAFGRRQMLTPRRTNVNKLVLDVAEMLSRTLGEAVRIETILSGSLWPSVLDPNQLESALLNVALNARDAMPHGGKLVIQTANMHFDRSYSAHYEGIDAGDYVMLSVSDTGIGIAKECLPKVFEPFFTTKEIGKGSGLGLAQVYGFVKQSGGHATVYSEMGIGTTVRMYFRRDHAASETEEQTERRSDPPRARSGEKILVVEDDPVVRSYSVEALRELGYRILEAEDAAAPLAILGVHHDIDLMFTDIGLPGMNGRALAETVVRQQPATKILYTTGYAGAALTANGTLGPDVALLQKPFTRDVLAESVRRVLDARAMA
ncbi:MAG TPA: MHYT domain-containing protein [Acetobacteraceae bacterium]